MSSLRVDWVVRMSDLERVRSIRKKAEGTLKTLIFIYTTLFLLVKTFKSGACAEMRLEPGMLGMNQCGFTCDTSSIILGSHTLVNRSNVCV